ncbi:MAG: hypothetical protein LBF13_01395, partial [Campylobacteraceae bacterium]|nr:hypothetical protein [Campylobacteraceae bacterium]
MHFSKKRILYLFGIFACLNMGLADENAIELMQIEVRAHAKESNVSNGGKGLTVIDSDYIKNAPSATNTITDLLRSKSYIQYDQTSRSSATGG